MGPSIKYATLFLANFDHRPPLVTPCHTSGNPPKVSHTSRNPLIFSRPGIQKTLVQILSQLFAGFLSGAFVRGSFVWKVLSGVVLSVPPSVRIHLLQQKVKHHFRFH